MGKKKPGRPNIRIPIDADKVKIRFNASGMVARSIVTQAARFDIDISESSIREAIRARKASPNVLRAISIVLEVSPYEFVKDTKKHADVLQAIHEELGDTERQRVFSGSRTRRAKDPSQRVQDKKNLIVDPKVSNALIKMVGVPSLYEAVCASGMYTPLNDAHKDTPYVPGMAYNHFLMLGVVVRLSWPKQEQHLAIAYHRQRGRLNYTYKHTKGFSILWATGFEYPVGVTRDPDMQHWIDLATENPRDAEDLFIGNANPTLLRLFTHKLKLIKTNCSIKPLGVVTNDQQPSKPRVYTQYVFQIDVELESEPPDMAAFLKTIVQEPDQPETIACEPQASDQFINDNGQPLRMDIAAWRLILGSKVSDKDAAAYSAGFEIK